MEVYKGKGKLFMMDELRKEFIDNCTLEGIIAKSYPLIGKHFAKISIICLLLLSLILYTLIYYIGCFVCGYDFYFFYMFDLGDKHPLFKIHMLFIMWFSPFLAAFIVIYLQNNLIISILSKKYNNLTKVYKILKDIDCIKYKFFTLPWNMNNHYYKYINFVISENRLIFENKYLRFKSKEFLNELIKQNDKEIQDFEFKANQKSNKTFYAFIGTLIISNIYNYMFQKIDLTSSQNIGDVFGIIFMVTIIAFIIVRFYNFINTELINNLFNRGNTYLKIFNRYIFDKKIKYFFK